jgi:wobble nucleotide-excising tRNase
MTTNDWSSFLSCMRRWGEGTIGVIKTEQEMIESIHIKNEASYGDEGQSLSGLSIHNFIYGSNGTGKTTISKVIDDEASFPECSIIWENGFPLETRVYNCEFVERNFNQSTELRGIFTLGEKDAVTIQKIDAIKKRTR